MFSVVVFHVLLSFITIDVGFSFWPFLFVMLKSTSTPWPFAQNQSSFIVCGSACKLFSFLRFFSGDKSFISLFFMFSVSRFTAYCSPSSVFMFLFWTFSDVSSLMSPSLISPGSPSSCWMLSFSVLSFICIIWLRSISTAVSIAFLSVSTALFIFVWLLEFSVFCASCIAFFIVSADSSL